MSTENYLKELLGEFQLKNFRLLYHDAADFTESPCFGVLVVLIYRFLFALYCFCWLIASGVHPSNGEEKWFIYLSNWSYFFLTLYFVFSTTLTAIYYRGEWMVGEYDVEYNDVLKPKSRSRPGELNQQPLDDEEPYPNPLDLRHEEPICWYHQALWMIYNIAAANALTVTASYWIFAYPQLADYSTPNGLDVSTYLLNTLFILIDTCISCIPIRLFHVIYPMLYFFIYVMFTVIYWASEGTNVQGKMYIYRSFDYTGSPSSAVGWILGYTFIALVLAQFLLFGLSKLRRLVGVKCCVGKRREYNVNT